MTELNKCPFCGGEAYLQKGHDCIASAVRCKVCEGAVFGHRDEVAVERWNNRWMIPCEEGKTESNWHTGTPTEDGDYLVAFRMSDNSVEYGWCNWNNGAWDILCDYDPTDGSCGMIAWQKIEPCNWFDFLFSEGHCDNWREVR